MDEKLDLTWIDVASFPGLVIVVVALTAAFKRFFPKYVKGNEPMLALGLTFVVGIASKLTVELAFANVPWVVFLISLVFVSMAAGSTHDRVVNPMLHNKPAPNHPAGKKPPAPAPGAGK